MRIRLDNISSFGLVNPITFANGSTATGTWASAPAFPTIAAPDYAVVVVESDTGQEEITYLTAYTSGGTSGTFLRGQEGSTGIAHSATAWLHGPTALDFTLGTPLVRGFAVAHGAAGLNNGVALFTPTVGDFLLDAWVEIDTAWNGTTPLGDIGTFGGGHPGWFAYAVGPIDMTSPDLTGGLDPNLLQGSGVTPGSDLLTVAIKDLSDQRTLPAKFTTATPVLFVVSQNGLKGGASPGATTGAAVVYVKTVTPDLT
jgi:hypothetical protein